MSVPAQQLCTRGSWFIKYNPVSLTQMFVQKVRGMCFLKWPECIRAGTKGQSWIWIQPCKELNPYRPELQIWCQCQSCPTLHDPTRAFLPHTKQSGQDLCFSRPFIGAGATHLEPLRTFPWQKGCSWAKKLHFTHWKNVK